MGEPAEPRSPFPFLIAALLILAAGAVGFVWHRKSRAERIAVAKSEIKNLKIALTVYEVDNEALPTTAQGLDALIRKPSLAPLPKRWLGPYWDETKIPLDPWGNPYFYRNPGLRTGFAWDLFSAGPDGLPDTPDDIVHF